MTDTDIIETQEWDGACFHCGKTGFSSASSGHLQDPTGTHDRGPGKYGHHCNNCGKTFYTYQTGARHFLHQINGTLPSDRVEMCYQHFQKRSLVRLIRAGREVERISISPAFLKELFDFNFPRGLSFYAVDAFRNPE
jgi:hypothetical protein